MEKETKCKFYFGGERLNFVTSFNNANFWMFLLRYLPQSSEPGMPSVTHFHPLEQNVQCITNTKKQLLDFLHKTGSGVHQWRFLAFLVLIHLGILQSPPFSSPPFYVWKSFFSFTYQAVCLLFLFASRLQDEKTEWVNKTFPIMSFVFVLTEHFLTVYS